MMPTPEDMNMVPSSMGGWIGFLFATAITVFFGLRKWLSSDAASRTADRVERAFMEALMKQLEAANERADRFAKERNEAIEIVGELRARIAELQVTVEHMQDQLARICPREERDEG